MDDQLLRLQEQFFQIQETQSNPLSDRTLVQLLLKLPSFGLIFYQTTDGTEYITQEHLDKSINETVVQTGKITTIQLAQALGLNYDIVESRLSVVTNKYNLTRIDEKLLSPGYLDSLVHILREKLEARGRMNVQEIAADFELPLIYARKFVQERINSIGAELNNDQIITDEYTLLKKARLAGALNGTLKPVQITQLCKRFDFEQRNTPETVEALIREKRLNGRLQHGYYIPYTFESNQKAIIQNMISANNYVEYANLQKNFFISKPRDWLKANFSNRLILLNEAAFSVSAIESCKHSIQNLLKNDGYAELAKVFPSAFADDDIQKLLGEHLNLNDVLLENGYCFDPEWLDKCASEFREKMLYYIFFKQEEPVKGKKPNKSKKPKVTQDELAEGLVDSGLIEYTAMQELRETLLRLLSPKLDQLFTKCSAEVAQNKGVITNALLKYRKGKTIIKNQEKCLKNLATIDKQSKKGEKQWVDPQFGPTEEDQNGILGLVYFDRTAPKQWPPLEKLKWVNLAESISRQRAVKLDIFSGVFRSRYLSKCKLIELLQLLSEFNMNFPDRQIGFRFLCPEINTQFEKAGVNVVKLFNQNEARYVLTDNLFPVFPKPNFDDFFYSFSEKSVWPSIVEKSYAKFRYCYKGTLGVGVVQTAQELGYSASRRNTELQNLEAKKQFTKFILSEFQKGLLIAATEGQPDQEVLLDGRQSGLKANKMYLVHQVREDGETGVLLSLKLSRPGEALLADAGNEYVTQQQTRGYCVVNLVQTSLLFKYIYSIN